MLLYTLKITLRYTVDLSQVNIATNKMGGGTQADFYLLICKMPLGHFSTKMNIPYINEI